MDFEWDEEKDRSNQAKHAISFDEAIAIFADAGIVVLDVTRIEDGEDRWKAIGLIEAKLFAVTFTMRDDVCRIISARRANSKEERIHGNR